MHWDPRACNQIVSAFCEWTSYSCTVPSMGPSIRQPLIKYFILYKGGIQSGVKWFCLCHSIAFIYCVVIHKMIFWFYGQKAFLLNALDIWKFPYQVDYTNNVLSWQRVITRQQKNTKEVQQFFLFNAKMVFIFVMICMQICLHYNCFQEIFSKKYFFPSSNGDLPESSRLLTASGVII